MRVKVVSIYSSLKDRYTWSSTVCHLREWPKIWIHWSPITAISHITVHEFTYTCVKGKKHFHHPFSYCLCTPMTNVDHRQYASWSDKDYRLVITWKIERKQIKRSKRQKIMVGTLGPDDVVFERLSLEIKVEYTRPFHLVKSKRKR